MQERISCPPLVATAPCSVHPSLVFEAVGSSSRPNRDSLAVMSAAWSKPINMSTRPPQSRSGGKSSIWLHRPRSFSHSITGTGLVMEGIVDPWIDTVSPADVLNCNSRYSEFTWTEDSSPTPPTNKVCRWPVSRSRRVSPSRMRVDRFHHPSKCSQAPSPRRRRARPDGAS